MSHAIFHVGDTRDVTATLDDNSIDLVLTSPPFLALRSYLPDDHESKHHEIGSEATPAAFIDVLLELAAEWRRVLAPHGSIAIELGDTYSGGDTGTNKAVDRPQDSGYSQADRVKRAGFHSGIRKMNDKIQGSGTGWPLAKSLTMGPELFRIALAYGINPLTGAESPAGQWRVRNVVRWHRPNPPVGALGDKYRPATTDMVVACVSDRRWFDLDAVRSPSKNPIGTGVRPTNARVTGQDDSDNRETLGPFTADMQANGAPPLDTWTIPTAPYKGAHYACVDDATEALTPRGWLRHDQLGDGDLIAAVDASGESWRFGPASFHRYDFHGDLVAIDKRVTNQRLTPNHRVVHRTRKDPTPRIRRADELRPGCQLPLASVMEPGGAGPGEKAAALAGWFCAEGHNPQRGWPRLWQSQSANPAHCDAIRQLLDGLGVDYTESVRHRQNGDLVQWTIRGNVGEWLRQFHKNLPLSAVFGWSDVEARALFDALVDGDGHRRPDGRISFIQKRVETAERVQMLAVRLGYRTTLRQRKSGTWNLTISPGRWTDLRSGQDGTDSAIGTERYDGTVWCPQVSTGMWLARRNGQPFITGNTWPPELCRIPIESMCPRQVCVECGTPRRRITSEPEYVRTSDGALTDGDAAWRSGRRGDVPGEGQRTKESMTRTTDTLGWSVCDCPTPTYRPGTVLDPFAGTGTTLAVATGHARNAIGIDIDPRNADLAQERVGMFLTTNHPQENTP